MTSEKCLNGESFILTIFKLRLSHMLTDQIPDTISCGVLLLWSDLELWSPPREIEIECPLQS